MSATTLQEFSQYPQSFGPKLKSYTDLSHSTLSSSHGPLHGLQNMAMQGPQMYVRCHMDMKAYAIVHILYHPSNGSL